jgi:hypothetical protein
MAARAIHFLSVSGEVSPELPAPSPALVLVRLHYADGSTEDHRVGSSVRSGNRAPDAERKDAARTVSPGDRSLRHFKIEPEKGEVIRAVELAAGFGATSPEILAVTAEAL